VRYGSSAPLAPPWLDLTNTAFPITMR
jgi:hypothetical protein